MKKVISLLILLCIAVSAFSCAEKEPEPTYTTIEVYRDGVSGFEVIAAGSSIEAINAASAFCTAFQEQTGIHLSVTYDYPNKAFDYSTQTNKIVFGSTLHPVSVDAYTALRYNNFKLEITNNMIAVAAHTEDGFAGAVDHIVKNILPSLVENGGSYTFEGERLTVDKNITGEAYAVEQLSVLGVPISSYRIVYSAASYDYIANALRDSIALKTGYVLECVRDGFTDPVEYEILIGDTSRPESALVEGGEPLHATAKLQGKKLVIKSGGKHSLALFCEKFVDNIAAGVTSLDITESFSVETNYITDTLDHSFSDGADIRVMSANVQANQYGYNLGLMNAGFDFGRCPEIFFSSLEVYKPTVVGLQECCDEWSMAIKNYKGYADKWHLLEFDNPNKVGETVFSTIMYRKDLLTLLDSGMQFYSKHNNTQCRCVSWAVFKDNASGKEFTVTSTHWDMNSSPNGNDAMNSWVQCAELSELMNTLSQRCPVFSTGDFNCSEDSEIFKTLMTNTNSKDCMHAAENRLNQESSHHGWGHISGRPYSPDHISAPNNSKVFKFESLIYNEQIFASDHSWLIADVTIP